MLKIVFLCGSLEPGRDGVGDYTLRLATELIGHHFEVRILALRDQYIKALLEGTVSAGGYLEIPVLRLPAVWRAKKRFNKAKEWIEEFKPEWISLQFVIFSFQRKGLPFGLPSQLAGLSSTANWHIMFHELWVGMYKGATKKYIIWGRLQRGLIRSVIKKLKPQVIHTHTVLYQLQLKKWAKVKVELLPLFSNIPKVIKDETFSFAEHPKNDVIVASFGLLHPHAQVELFVEQLAAYQKKYGINLGVHIIGHTGPEVNRWVSLCQVKGLELKITGKLPSEEVSFLLQKATAAFTTTALPMIQKSGSVAAMREHGLPVMCISNPWLAAGIILPANTLSGVYNLGDSDLEAWLSASGENISETGVKEVSHLFVESIK